MSYFSQMAGLAWHNFTSAAAGLGVALALARGLTRGRRSRPGTLGNFWVDLMRSILYVLLPICLVFALVLVSQGDDPDPGSPYVGGDDARGRHAGPHAAAPSPRRR